MTKLVKDNSKPKTITSNQANKYDTLKNSLNSVAKEYCLESSICGLKHLVNDDSSKYERYIWVLTMVGALICSVSLVWVTFDKYYKAPLVTTQLPEGISVSEIVFPSTGICTINRISKKAATRLAEELLREERNRKYDKNDMLSLLGNLGILYNMGEFDNVTPLHEALGDYDTNQLLRDLTPRCEDFLIACAWNDQPMNCTKLFDFRLTMRGYCCTFNYLRESDNSYNKESNIDMLSHGNKSAFGFDQGLKVLLRIDDSDNFFQKLLLEGAVLQFSDPYDFPDDPSGSFANQIISPTIAMTVLISSSLTEASRDIQHLPVSLRGCMFNDESTFLPIYTHSDCIMKCRMLFLLEKCNCTPYNMPKDEGARTCNLMDMACIKLFFAQSISIRPGTEVAQPHLELDLIGGGISCSMCYPTCSKTTYIYVFDNIDLYPDFMNSLPDYNRDNWLQGVNFTKTSLLQIRYASEVADIYEQNVIMKWFDLFSNIGSTCGFVTGFSFVSVLEFLYFFTVKLTRTVKERRRLDAAPAHPYQVRSPYLTKQHTLYWNELTMNIPTRHVDNEVF